MRISSPKSYFVIRFTVNIAIFPLKCKLRLNFFEFSQRFKANFFLFFTLDSGGGECILNVHFSQQNSHTIPRRGFPPADGRMKERMLLSFKARFLFFCFLRSMHLFSGESGGTERVSKLHNSGKNQFKKNSFFSDFLLFSYRFFAKKRKNALFFLFFSIFFFSPSSQNPIYVA